MTVDARALRKMSRDELDDVFRSSDAGTIPVGKSKGTAIVAAGSLFGRMTARFVRRLAWQGKVFSKEESGHTFLRNLTTPVGKQAFRAEVYEDDSWFADGRAIVLDYSKSSFLVRKIRDEMREVSEGLYLGQVFWGKERVLLFMLEFPTSAS